MINGRRKRDRGRRRLQPVVLCGALLAPALLAGGLLAVELTGYEEILRSAIADPAPRTGTGSGDIPWDEDEEGARSRPDDGAVVLDGHPPAGMTDTGAVAVVPVVVDSVPAGLFTARLTPPPPRPDQVYGGWVLVAAGAEVVEAPHEIGAAGTTGDMGDTTGGGGTGGADGAGDAGGVGGPVGGTAGTHHPDAFVPVRIQQGSPEARKKTREETSDSYAMPADSWLERVEPVAAPRVMRTVPVPPWKE